MKYKNTAVIILAGGQGRRFGKEKQFFLINKKTILEHTISAWRLFNKHVTVVVVAPDKKLSFLARKYGHDAHIFFVHGGGNRMESTREGLRFLSSHYPSQVRYVYIHDVARPVVSKKHCLALYKALLQEKTSGAVLYLPISDSLISFTGSMSNNVYVNRSGVASLQTPHLYKFDDITTTLFLYDGTEKENAEIVESYGKTISYVRGYKENIKVTYQEDVSLLKKILK
jgi:2-C-methyl-D-erythritol 4-phosphate cytidylyltransferase